MLHTASDPASGLETMWIPVLTRALLGSNEEDVRWAVKGVHYIILLSANCSLMHGSRKKEAWGIYKNASLYSRCILISGRAQAD